MQHFGGGEKTCGKAEKNCGLVGEKTERSRKTRAKQETKLGDSLKHFIKLPPSVCCYVEATPYDDCVFFSIYIYFSISRLRLTPRFSSLSPLTLAVNQKKVEKTFEKIFLPSFSIISFPLLGLQAKLFVSCFCFGFLFSIFLFFCLLLCRG